MLLAWLSGNLVAELTSPGDRQGLAWIKVFVLVFSGFGVFVHLLAFFYKDRTDIVGEMLYVR